MVLYFGSEDHWIEDFEKLWQVRRIVHNVRRQYWLSHGELPPTPDAAIELNSTHWREAGIDTVLSNRHIIDPKLEILQDNATN